MQLKVGQHKIEIIKNPVNEREINISKCQFEFDDEITNNYVKEAYFTFEGVTYKQIIVNDECDFPNEVLTKKGTVEIGVVAYLVENETEIKRYNPSPAYFDTWIGSLKDNAENSEPITPSEMEQYEQALNDGLNEVANVDIDAVETLSGASVTITNRQGQSKTVSILNGKDGADGKDGKDGAKGEKGDKGDTGVNGSDGKDGADGFSPIATVSKSGNTTIISITDKNGTTTATVNDGAGAVASVNGKTGAVVLDASDVGALPSSTVIPSKTSDLTNDSGFVNASGAASAAPVQSVNGQTGAVSLSIPSSAADVGAIATPSSANTGDFLVYNGTAWVAQTLSMWQGGSY